MSDKFLVALCGFSYPEENIISDYFEEENQVVLMGVNYTIDLGIGSDTVFFDNINFITIADLVVFKISEGYNILNTRLCDRMRIPYLVVGNRPDMDFVKEEISKQFVEWTEWNLDCQE